MSRYMRSRNRDKGYVDYIIETCGECPDRMDYFCIRKKVIVDKGMLYSQCPLPIFS